MAQHRWTSEEAKKFRGPGHRRKNSVEHLQIKAAQDIVREILEANAEDLANHFIKRAKQSDQVLNMAINKLLPEINPYLNQRPIAIQVIIENPHGGSTNGAADPTATREGDGRTVLIGD